MKAEAPQRLLFFADASSVHTRRWVGEMAARGHRCTVVTRLAGDVAGADEVIVLRPGHGKLGWFLELPRVRTLARKLRPDWVHGHYITSYGLWAAACRLPGAPWRIALTAWGSDILVTPREPGLSGALMRRIVGWSLPRADLITADSQDVLDEIASYPGVRAPRHLILWGADTDRFMPAAQTPAGFDVVSLRSWEPNYNIDVILQAFATFAAARPQAGARLHLLGGGPLEARLRQQAADLGIAAQVLFHGRVGDAAMVEAIQGSRVSVSIPTSDATSVSVLESMACGLPVIASDLPANRAWVGEAGGALVAPRDAAGVTAALTALHDDPPRAAHIGAHNRERVEREGSRRGQMDRMSALLAKEAA
ncbi:MAG: glycosyltransferase [Aquabacterium sp.]|nr:MAG: glycosyltransferase [Aquabacterium sp.]